MPESVFIILHSARIFGCVCLLASLGLCPSTPEGALFLFVTGCTWLGLSCLAQGSRNQNPDQSGTAKAEEWS